MRGALAAAEDALRRRLKVRVSRQEDIRHEALRVAIDQREPGALDLHHDPVARTEHVIVAGEAHLVFTAAPGTIGSGFSKLRRYRPRKTSPAIIS